MPLTIDEKNDGRLLIIHASGKLEKPDYEFFGPAFDRLAGKYGKLRILFDMRDFHGWQAAALWEDLKFDIHHFKDIQKLAMVGDKAWQHWMSIFCKPFTTAEIKYFDQTDLAEAETWVAEGMTAASPGVAAASR